MRNSGVLIDIHSSGYETKSRPCEYIRITLKDLCAEDVWDLKLFSEQTFHMLLNADHLVYLTIRLAV